MRNKWAQGIKPRHFRWILKDQLAVCERLGGISSSHRRVRKQEEILWIRQNRFSRVVSLLPADDSLKIYKEFDVSPLHFPFSSKDSFAKVLPPIFEAIERRIEVNEKLLVYRSGIDDEIMGFFAGFLMYTRRINNDIEAACVVEKLFEKQMGTVGRKMLNIYADHAGVR